MKPQPYTPSQQMINRVILYIHLGYSVTRLVQLFGVREATAYKLKQRFG